MASAWTAPALQERRGDQSPARQQHDQPTSLNWHGVRIVNAMDGTGGLTQEPVPPGGSFDYVFNAS